MACADHPARDEAFACSHCASPWCDACVRRVGTTAHAICPRCGHEVRPATPERDGHAMFRDAIARVWSMEGITTALGFAVFWALSALFSVLAVAYFAALVSYYFTIVRHVGDGRAALPGPADATDDWLETLGFALRGILVALLGVAPLFVLTHAHGEPSLARALLWLAAGQTLVPAVLIALVSSNNPWAIVWPVAWVQVIARAPAAYARFVAIWLVSVAAGIVLWLATRAMVMPIAVVGDFLAATIWNLFWFAQAVLVGHFLRNNAERFGWS